MLEFKYIFAIVCGGIFFIAFIACLVVTFRTKKREERRMAYIYNMYADKNLVKMEYDCAVYDSETERLLEMRDYGEGQISINEIMSHNSTDTDDTFFVTVDTEGLEEITGNYKP